MHSLGKKNNFLFQLQPIFKALRITLFKVRLLKTAQIYDSRYNGFLQD